MIKKILFFKLGAIGDTLMTTPLIRQVRKNFPDAQIDYLIGNSSASVLENNLNINNIITFDEMIFVKKKIIQWHKLISKIKRMNYDLIFVLDKHRIFNLSSKLFGIKIRVGFDRLGKEGIFLTNKVYYGEIRHEIYYYLDLAKEIGLKVNYKDTKMNIFLSNKDKKFANEFWKKHKLNGKKVIAVCPGGAINYAAKTYVKRVPTEKFIEIINFLLKKGLIVLLIGGKSDLEIEKKILENVSSKNLISLISETSIHQSAAILEKCKKVICNDSGPMHIAASVNKNIISIFGPTNPARFAPLWKQSKYIWKANNIYDAKGEIVGKYNKGNYFENFSVNDIKRYV